VPAPTLLAHRNESASFFEVRAESKEKYYVPAGDAILNFISERTQMTNMPLLNQRSFCLTTFLAELFFLNFTEWAEGVSSKQQTKNEL